MGNVHGTWRCVCELDTAHIHVMAIPNHAVELSVCILHLLSLAIQAGMGLFDLEPPQVSDVEAVDELCAWYVKVCV